MSPRLADTAERLLDRAEGGLRRGLRALERPGAFHGAVVALVLLAVVVRLPLLAEADDVPHGHNDANIYFNWVYTVYLDGDVVPDAHRASGWHLLLYLTFQAFGVEAGGWVPKGATQMTPEALHAASLAYALSTMLAAGAVVAVYFLARQVLPPLATLGAMLLVALDPYLLSITTSSMSEPPYTIVFVLALACVLRARRHPAWLVPMGALMSVAHVFRVNGLVMLVMALAFAWLLLRDVPRARRLKWMGAAVAAFLLIASPYLAWRSEHLPGAFDYGTNQRFWADDLWDLDDAWWSNHTNEHGAPRETMRDWFATHTLADAVSRLYVSVQWQVFDLFGFGKWPPLQEEGGAWVGTDPDGSALTPLLVALSFVAAFAARRRRDLWFLPLAVLFTMATFVWIYPLVRSVRYFSPLIPLFVVYAMAGWLFLATLVRRPHLVGALLFGAWIVLYAARVLIAIPEGIAHALATPDVRAIVLLFTLAWVALALAPLATGRRRRGMPRPPEETA